MNKKSILPSEKDPFISIAQILEERDKYKATIGSIAEAMETRPIYEWDKFGRFKLLDKKSKTPNQALENAYAFLERIYSHECYAPPSDFHPLDEDPGPRGGPLDCIGWISSQIPNLESLYSYSAIDHSQSGATRSIRSSYLIIAALAKKLKIDISKENRNRASTVKKCIDFAGLTMDEETITKYLDAAYAEMQRKIDL